MFDADIFVDVFLFCSSSPKPWVTGLLSPPLPPLLQLPSPPILIMQLFSFSPGGGLPWTNIVPCASSSGGPYCVWRNGELTPMSEPSQWGHCVWIFLQLTQSHPRSLPCTGQARGYRVRSPIMGWKHAHNSQKPITTTDCFTFRILFIFQQTTLSWICLCGWLWQKWGPVGAG